MTEAKVGMKVHVEVDMSVWTGRTDPEEGPAALRWHEVIRPAVEGAEPGVALLGLACDEGVRRNQGRPGARRGPRALRGVLANFAAHSDRRIYDAGDVECAASQPWPGGALSPRAPTEILEQAQAAFAARVTALLAAGHLPVGLGGGHEIALASFTGLANHLTTLPGKAPRVGILNLDAHFDLRTAPAPTSGTSFLNMAQLCRASGWEFNYCCLGIAEPANTAALFNRARELGVTWRLDTDLSGPRLPETQAILREWLSRLDCVYLTVCLDVLPAAVAPGVSAPAPRGVPLEVLELLIADVKQSGKLALADVAELNPDFDIDQHTARVAARLVYQITR